jgi:hypothetical protein
MILRLCLGVVDRLSVSVGKMIYILVSYFKQYIIYEEIRELHALVQV